MSNRNPRKRTKRRARTPLDRLTGTIVTAAFETYARLGPGYRETVYAKALAVALQARGITSKAEQSFPVCLTGDQVGTVRADLDVEETILVEVKACREGLRPEARRQLAAALRASGRPVGLLINFFGAKLGVKRVRPDRRRRGGTGGEAPP